MAEVLTELCKYKPTDISAT